MFVNMKTVLIVGASFVTIRSYLLEHGMDYVLLKDARKLNKTDKLDDKVFACDFSSKQTILRDLKMVTKNHQINGVMATYENYVLPAALITKELKLPGLPIEAAEACTDKLLMRQKFMNAPIKISPNFKEINNYEELIDFAKNNSFPLILKPANLVKSLLVTKSYNLDELKNNYQKTVETIGEIYQKYAPERQPKILVEEFMVGPIHSVDAFIDSTGTPHVLKQVVDYQTGYDVGFDDNFHYSRLLPSALPQKDIEAIRKAAKLGCEALDMKNSPAHIEIIRTQEGPMIVEIGARNGGYRERMHNLADGIDILKNAIALATGEKLDLEATKQDFCTVLELFPKKSGIFKAIENEKELIKLKSLYYFAVKQPYNQYVGKSSEGYKMCAIVILASPNKDVFNKDLEFVSSKVKVVTE